MSRNCEMLLKELEVERSITEKMEFAIQAMLIGDLHAYHHMRDALKFAEDQRKGAENARRIQDLPRLAGGKGSS